MPSLRGTVDLNYKQALTNLRAFRAEFQTTKKELGGMVADVDTAPARRGIRQLSDEEKKANDEKKRLDKEAADNKKRLDREAANARKELDREAANANKQAIRDEAQERKKANSSLKADIQERYKEEMRLQAEADKAAIRGAQEVANARRKAIEEGRQALDKLGDKLSMGATLAGAGILGGLGLASKAFIDFDDSFADVRKTVEGTRAELDGIGDSLLSLSTKIPVSAQKLTQIAADAGQLGVSRAGIVEFTKTVADLTTVTKLSTDEAASDMAKLGNITRIREQDYGRLGSVVAKLGNIGASTEKQVLDMGLRIAGAAKQVGASEAEILGTSNALASLGIEAEAGGTAWSRTIILAAQAVHKGGDELKTFAQIAGVSSAEFKRRFETNATGALTDFVKGLGKLKKADLFDAFDALGIKSSRMKDTLARAALAGDLMAESVKDANEAWEKNTFLTEKAALRNDTNAAKIKLAQAEVNRLAISIGRELVPAEAQLLSYGERGLKFWNGLSEGTRKNTVEVTALAGGALLLIGQLKNVFETVGLVKTVFVGMSAQKALDAEATTAHTLALEANTAALLANSEAAGANTLVTEANAAAQATATATTAEGLGTVATESAAAAAGVGGLSVGFTILAPLIAVVGTAVGLYAINTQAVAENNAKLEGANAGVVTSNKLLVKSFDDLNKSASDSKEAAKAVGELQKAYEKFGANNLQKFVGESIPKAQREISLSPHISSADKSRLLGELDDLTHKAQQKIDARNYKFTVQAEVDEGSLAKVRKAFYGQYGWLYDTFKSVTIIRSLELGSWAWGQLKYGAGEAGKWIGRSWKNTMDALPSPVKSALDRVDTIWHNSTTATISWAQGQWNGFYSWLRGVGASHGEDGANLPSTGGYGADWAKRQKAEHAAFVAAQTAAQVAGPLPQAFMRGGGGLSASSDRYGDPGIPKPKVSSGAPAPWTPGTSGGDGGNGKRTKEENQLLRQQKDALDDVTKGYQAKGEAAKKAAQEALDSGKTELDSLKDLRDAFKDKFGSIQDEFVSLGVINNPMAPQIAAFEKLLDIAGKSKKAIADARAEYNGAARDAKNAQNGAAAAQSKKELLSGLDGIVPTSGGSLETGPIGSRIAQNALRMQERWGDKIGAVFYRGCDRLADATVNGATKAFASIMGSRKGDTAARTMARFKAAGIGFAATAGMSFAPGDIVYTGSSVGKGAGHVQVVAPDGRFSDQYGLHSKPTTRPQWVVRADGSNARGIRFGGSPGGSGAGGSRAFDLPDFDLMALDGSLSKIGAVDKAWGTAVKNIDGNSSRFALQTSLASKEFQTQIQAAATKTGKTVPEIVAWLRQLANSADAKLNRVRAVDAVTDAIKELDKTRRAIGTDKNPFASIFADFQTGGKYADAPDKMLALLDAQRKLTVAQTSQATREATQAEREKTKVLQEAAPFLSAATAGTNTYDKALEKVQRRFDVWKSPDLTGLLDEAKTYDVLAAKAEKLAAALAKAKGVAAPGAAAKLLDTAKGYRGRAAGSRAKANSDAGARLDAANNGSDFADSEGRRKTDVQTRSEMAAQLDGLQKENTLLSNLSLTEEGRTAQMDRFNFALETRNKLLSEGNDEVDTRQKTAAYLAMYDERKEADDFNKALKALHTTLNNSPKLGELVKEATDKIDGGLNNSTASAAELKAILDALSDSIKNLDKAPADLQWKVGGSKLLDLMAQLRARIATQQGNEDAQHRKDLLQPFDTQNLDLQKQMEAARLSSRRPLSSLAQQNLDWKYEDLAGPKRSAADQAIIDGGRDSVRALLKEWDTFERDKNKITKSVDIVGGAFDNMFDSVLSRQKSFGAAMRDGFESTLTGLASDFLKSQFRSLLTNMFGGIFGGGTQSILSNVVPFATGGISAGLNASKNSDLGGYGVQLHSAKVGATGIERIERDGQVIVAHRGEQLLNAAQAESYRQQRQAQLMAQSASNSSGGNGPTQIIYIHEGDIVTPDPASAPRKVAEGARRLNGPWRAPGEMVRQTQKALSQRRY